MYLQLVQKRHELYSHHLYTQLIKGSNNLLLVTYHIKIRQRSSSCPKYRTSFN